MLHEIEFGDFYQFRAKGHLTVVSTKFDGDKKLGSEIVLDSSNLIVTLARTFFPVAVTNPDDHNYILKYMAFGQGHHAAGDPDTPVQPRISETVLEDELYRHDITSYTYPSNVSTSIYTLVLTTEGNIASYYTEFGLFADAGMFAIRAADNGRVEKNDTIQLELYWRLLF